MRFVWVMFFSVIVVSTSNAQFNSKIGYNLSYANTESLTSLFDSFNDSKPWLDQKLSGINFVHGLEIGARYRSGNLAFEIGIISGGGENKAIGVDPNSLGTTEFRYKVSTFDYHFNVTQYFGNIGFGVGVGRQRLKFKEYNQISQKFDEISEEKQWSGKMFLQFEVPSKRVAISFRPFYQISFDDYDLSTVASSLDVSSSGGLDYKVFGLSIIFFNGPQP